MTLSRRSQELRSAARQIALVYGIYRARAPAIDLSITGVGPGLRHLLVGKQNAAQWLCELGSTGVTAERLVGDSRAVLALSPDAEAVLELAPGGAPAAAGAGAESAGDLPTGRWSPSSPVSHIVLFPIVDKTVRSVRGAA